MNRYDRQIRLAGFGNEKQELLRNAAVLVVGAGGLGVPVLQYLTAMGVGRIGIAEEDKVSITNLQRQVLYQTADEGQPKLSRALDAEHGGVVVPKFGSVAGGSFGGEGDVAVVVGER